MNQKQLRNIKNKISYYWLCQIGGWGTFILINSVLYYALGLSNGFHPHYFKSLFFLAFTGLIITHTMRSVIQGINILHFPLHRQILWFIVITVSFGLIYSSVTAASEEALGWEPIYYRTYTFVEKWLKDSVGAILYITIWNLSYFAYHYISSLQRKVLNEARLGTVVKELELKNIKAHINPHFIFNALNSIRALVDEDPEKARTAITTLGILLRKSLRAEKGDTINLQEELGMVKNYLELEQIRFEDRLKVTFDIDEDTLEQKIPPMMLQTLVENAIKHGISREVKGGEVHISSLFVSDHHEIRVKNTGTLNGHRPKEGFGLASTKQRLELLYGGKGKFDIRVTEDHMVEASVILPVNLMAL